MLNAVACSLMAFSGFPVFLDGDGLVLTHMAGVVRDADQKPIARATVSLTGTLGHYETRRNTLGTGNGVSDAEGHYRLSFFTKLGGAVDVLGAKAEARGFVRADLKFPKGKLVMKPGETTEFNIVLAKGEVLAGVVSVPVRLRDRFQGNNANAQQHFFRVRGGSVEQVFRTEPGGAFEVWVPKGTYTLDLVTIVPPKGQGQEFSWGGAGPALENVASGKRGLKLRKVDPVIEPEAASRAFDAVWEDMALKYSHFELKRIDWNGLKTQYRLRAVAARVRRCARRNARRVARRPR
jgi:hypothetical protein